jgi:hypothetical protein
VDADDIAGKLAAMMHEGAVADALVLIALQADPAVAASAISSAVKTLYRSHRDVSNMVVAAYLGVAWCLGQASLQSDPEVAANLKRRAHAMSFNAAANCWPGWDDEGVTIEDAEVKAARSLAGTCLALAHDLDLGPKGLGTAHWVIGALELALGRFSAARAAFQDAQRSYAALGEEAPQKLMAQGYDALAAKLGNVSSDECSAALKEALERLHSLGTEGGQFFADQIARAERVLSTG